MFVLRLTFCVVGVLAQCADNLFVEQHVGVNSLARVRQVSFSAKGWNEKFAISLLYICGAVVATGSPLTTPRPVLTPQSSSASFSVSPSFSQSQPQSTSSLSLATQNEEQSTTFSKNEASSSELDASALASQSTAFSLATTLAIAIGIPGVICIIAIGLIVCFVCRRGKRGHDRKKSDEPQSPPQLQRTSVLGSRPLASASSNSIGGYTPAPTGSMTLANDDFFSSARYDCPPPLSEYATDVPQYTPGPLQQQQSTYDQPGASLLD